MDGKDLLRRLRQLLNEDSDSGWLDEQSSYDFLYDAAVEYVDRTACLRTSQSITTVADDEAYDLKPDFLKLYLRNKSGDFYIKINDGSNDYFSTFKDYEDIYYQNNTTSIAIPSHFTIIDASIPSQVTGTATSSGAASNGECTLTDSAADFSDVEAGAVVNNTTDGSNGIVLSKTSTTALVTALYGGTDNDWDSSDAYVIQPQGRYQIILDPPPSTANYTIYVPYVQRPAPVYSDFGAYRFANPSLLVKYAFWLYKYRDREPNFGDAMYRFWDMEVRKKAYTVNRAQRPSNWKVNLKKRA